MEFVVQEETTPVAARSHRARVPLAGERHLHLRGHVPALDGVRGLAIALVLFHHVWPFLWGGAVATGISKASEIGWVGVDLFFVLSGFLITGILLDSRGTPHYFRNFIVRRSLRIFPLYLLFLFLCFVVLPPVVRAVGFSDELLLANRDLLPWLLAYNANHMTLFNDPAVTGFLGTESLAGMRDGMHDFLAITWSLSVEEQFYLVWPFLVAACAPSLPRLAMTLCLVAIVARVAAICLIGDWPHVTNMATFCRMDSLAVGAALAAYVRSPSFCVRHYEWFWKLAAGVILPVVLVYTVFVGARGDALFAAGGYSLCAVGFAGIVAGALRKRRGLLRRVLETRVMTFLGTYSYGLYLYHMLILFLVGMWRAAELRPNGTVADPERFQPFFGDMRWDAPLRLILVTALTIGTAWLSFHLFEKRFLSLKRLWTR